MSSSKGFTEEELAALMPWAVPRVGRGGEAAQEAELEVQGAAPCETKVVEEEVETAPMLTAAEIELMQKQAYEEAAEQGRKDGWAQGHRDGYTAGHEQGYAAGQAEVSEIASNLEQVLTCLEEPLENMDDQVVNEMATLSIAIARQLIRRELKTDPGQIVAVVRAALAALPSASRKVSLYLHPDDSELVRSALSLDDGGQRWKLVVDPLLSRGGCKVVTETSAIDATVETRLAAVIAKTFGGNRGEDVP
jgi:flagellar assembly protein FliH